MKLWTRTQGAKDAPKAARFPGVRTALDGSSAVIAMETAASEAAGVFPIAPSAPMGEGWARTAREGGLNVNGRALLFFEPEDGAAAAAVTAGLSMAGLRATSFSSGPGLASMHESLYADAGRRLTYVLNVAARALTKQATSVQAGHDDYHAVDDTGFFQLFARNVQEAADLNLVAHRIAELSLNPGIVAQDGYLTSHVIESVQLPERALIEAYLGDPADRIQSPTKAQRLVFGETRRRIPELFDLDYPASFGVTQNQDSYAQGVAAQRPFYFDHLAELSDDAFREFAVLTGRSYARASGYRLDDAEWVIIGQGCVVSDAEAVADHLRATRTLKVGVLNLTMFRPFPSDLITAMLAGKKGVLVMERADQPLAVDPPLLREIRAAMSKGLESGRSAASHPGLLALRTYDVPEFYSACFGLGGRDLQPGDIVAAVDNMLPGGAGRRQFYLGIEFVRGGTRLPKLQIWQDTLTEGYPDLSTLALKSAGDLDLQPEGATAVRIHSRGGWGLDAMGRDLAMTAFDLMGLHVKATPASGSEKKGQPTTFSAVLAPDPIRLNCEPRRVDVVLSPDPHVFRHRDPLNGLSEGGVLVLQTEAAPEAVWKSLPAQARRTIVERRIQVCCLDAFAIARDEALDVRTRYRLLSAAFLGAFFRSSSMLLSEKTGQDALFEHLGARWRESLGAAAAEENLRALRRGFGEVRVAPPPMGDLAEEKGEVPHMPMLMESPKAQPGLGHEGRFWEQVCSLHKLGQDGIADPFAAISAIPAATAAVRDLSSVRLEAPEFLGAKCTGCAECWMQCPDSAIPGLVNTVEDVLGAAISVATEGTSMDRLRPMTRNWAKETQKLLQKDSSLAVGLATALAYDNVASKMGWDAERRAATDAEFHVVQARLAEFPLARTKPFFDALEAKAKGTGGLLSVTINPDACKGCNLCVEVCAPGALVTIKQDEPVLQRQRRNWALWNRLPDTDDRFLNLADPDEGAGVLSSLLLKKDTYRTMVGGDGACSGCGEKTAAHLVLSAIHAQMAPRVAKHVAKLDGLIEGLDGKARELLASGADLHAAARARVSVAVPVNEASRKQLAQITRAADAVRDLRWRYVEGPSGKGRATLGMANSTGCSSVWASTYPFNPYPFPWVSHLSADSPSVAIGLFEAHMRKMADGFVAVRRAAKVQDGSYDAGRDETELAALTWKEFTDEEFLLCPPILAMGGDGAMQDAGFQSLSRVLSSGRPIRVVVLDTQGRSDSGGQASTSSFTGQATAESRSGTAFRGRAEVRKELGLLAIAHRGVFVHQSSQASPAHLMAGVLKGLKRRRPALFNVYTPCPMEHGLADNGSNQAARLALESRAFPFFTCDPDAGASLAASMSLDGNPSIGTDWPAYTLRHLDEAGAETSLEVPLTVADWAATEDRFKEQFSDLPEDLGDEAVSFDQFVRMPRDEREGKTAFILAVGPDRRLRRLRVGPQIAALADDRLRFWSQLRELAGLQVSEAARLSVSGSLQAEFEAKMAALRAEYEARIAELKREYPKQIARKLAEGLIKHGGGGALSDLLATLPATGPSSGGGAGPAPKATAPSPASAPAASTTPAAAVTEAPPAPAAEATTTTPAPVASDAGSDEPLVLEAYIDSARCTTCNECTNLNKRMFVYNAAKQAEIKDPSAGTFQQLVLAAERCPVAIIHPGTPLNPNEKDLEKWVKRAEKFN